MFPSSTQTCLGHGIVSMSLDAGCSCYELFFFIYFSLPHHVVILPLILSYLVTVTGHTDPKPIT
jgi:hypothetical protein